jgi:ABC-type antimicrobial peptide transport system permease subunit
VVWSVLRRGALLIALGTAIGVAIVAGLSRVFTSRLFEVTPLDPASGLAILVLVIVAVLACFVPAIRATRVDPVTALRSS